MKRTVLSLIIISCVLTFVPAQENNRREQRVPGGQPSRQRPNAESVSINGNLTIVKGTIAVVSGDTTYFVGGLQRFVGFIDGLKEGAAVALEGNAISVPQNDKVKFLQVKKMTLSGKDYDFNLPRITRPEQMGQRGPGPQARPSQMGKRGQQPMYRNHQSRGREHFNNNRKCNQRDNHHRQQPMRRSK